MNDVIKEKMPTEDLSQSQRNCDQIGGGGRTVGNGTIIKDTSRPITPPPTEGYRESEYRVLIEYVSASEDGHQAIIDDQRIGTRARVRRK